MDPHPDFADVTLPREFELAGFHLTPLTMDQVDEDLAAVQAAAHLIKGTFGDDWPDGLTRQDNLIDLAWHDREFTSGRSFAWIVRDAGGLYLGCFYIYPLIGGRGAAQATLWLGDIADRHPRAATLKAALDSWLADKVPASVTLDWVTSPEV